MFIELIHPTLFDINTTADRFKVRLKERDAPPDIPGRVWLNLTYLTIDDAITEARKLLTALEEVKSNGVKPYSPNKLDKGTDA